jgi:hypothetical protein
VEEAEVVGAPAVAGAFSLLHPENREAASRPARRVEVERLSIGWGA